MLATLKKILLALLIIGALTLFGLMGSWAEKANAKEYKIGERVTEQKAPEKGAEKAGDKTKPADGFRPILWDELIPKDWNPRKLIQNLQMDKLQDNDPRAAEAMAQLRAEWDQAPVVKSLNGSKIRMPGFVVALEVDKGNIGEFLLVPYYGACIHVPPPPANQTIHVLPAQKFPEKMSWYPVWVSGTLETTGGETKLGTAGYRIRAVKVEPYEEKKK